MPLQEIFEEILELQHHWSSENTDEMRRRGELIRRFGPELIRKFSPRLRAALGPTGSDLIIEGRDGTGRKTEIPWIRFASKSRSPGAQDGWYCVFLFHAKGLGVHLSLMHGSTQFINGEYVPRSDEELHRHVMWARSTVGESQSADYPALTNIDLGTLRPLGQAYQKSSAMARWYRREALPNDTELEEAAVFFAGLLRKLYDAGDLGRAPDSPPPEVAACEYAIEHIARPGADTRKNKGQGFGLNAEERRTIEFHAMTKAEAHLRKEGFELRDVSRTHSYDFIATKGDIKLIVEVKGTTSALGAIVLTANEVDAHLEHYPHNMLIVVHTIDLDRSLNNGVAFGGEIRILCPWELINENLRPLSYQYRLDDVT